MSQMILEYDEFCMFLLNIEVVNIMTPDFPYTSENDTEKWKKMTFFGTLEGVTLSGNIFKISLETYSQIFIFC